MYDHNLTLKKTGLTTWTLSSEKDITVHEFSGCADAAQALIEANAWVSSWSSINIRIDDEQDKKRD